MAAEFHLAHSFDPVSKRHYLNDNNSVLHCHHYSTLYTQLALEFEGFGGVEQLIQVGEEVFGGILKSYFQTNAVDSLPDRISLAQQYWKEVGMGLVNISMPDEKAGTAKMEYSHLDEGWLKKWGNIDRPVNFFTQGFLAGACAAIYDKPFNSYLVEETNSLVRGHDCSEFVVTLK
jgi:predicted hydrocarbon binding protein